MNNSDDGASHNNRTDRPTDEGRCCWVCFATNDDDALAEWVSLEAFFSYFSLYHPKFRHLDLGTTMQMQRNN